MPAGWQIVDDVEDARLRSRAIAAVLAQDEPSRLRTLLNLLTKGAANRSIHQLLRETVKQAHELFLESPPEAWQQVPRYKPLAEDELAATLEDLRTLAVPGSRMVTARDADYDRAVQGRWDEFLTTGLAAKIHAGENTYHGAPLPPEAVAVYQRLLEHVRAVLVGRVASQTAATAELLERFHGHYQQLQQRQRALRFADVARYLTEGRWMADAAALAWRLDSPIDHLLLDEFQDTSPPQWRVLRPLAERVTAGDAATSLFCVGDVKQAIYGWRGGVAEIFDAIDQQLPGLQTLALNTSYRSAPPVIEAVNRVFTGLTAHPNLGRAAAAVHSWCARFEPHSTARRQLPGYAALLTGPATPAGGDAHDTLLAFAAERVAELTAQAPGCSLGVLVRTNETVAHLIYRLRKLGLRASEEGGRPLTDSAAVQVVLSLLRLADHPGHTVARYHLAHSPLAGCVGFSDPHDDRAARRMAQEVRRALVRDGYGPASRGGPRLWPPAATAASRAACNNCSNGPTPTTTARRCGRPTSSSWSRRSGWPTPCRPTSA